MGIGKKEREEKRSKQKHSLVERRSTLKLLISDQKIELRDIYIRNQHQNLTIVDILE
jgi:hypothetical protein